MNTNVLNFFKANYAPGRVCLVGSTNPLYKFIREIQKDMTVDKKPSKYNHAFLMGNKRNDQRSDGNIYIFESDLHVSVQDGELKNGVMEARITKWCMDDLEYAAVLGMDLIPPETDALVGKALWYAYDEHHLRYPVGELFGTLWAMLTHRMARKNIFDLEYAEQCASFTRICYKSIGRDFIAGGSHPSNTSPEEISQSKLFTFRKEWVK